MKVDWTRSTTSRTTLLLCSNDSSGQSKIVCIGGVDRDIMAGNGIGDKLGVVRRAKDDGDAKSLDCCNVLLGTHERRKAGSGIGLLERNEDGSADVASSTDDEDGR